MTQKLRLCMVCDKTFKGCQVFDGYVRNLEVCSISCEQKYDLMFNEELE